MEKKNVGWLNSTPRSKAVKINTITAVLTQPMVLIISFIVRMFFIRNLGDTYNGLNGLFTNLLSVLSFAELGIGVAISSAMYKPIARQELKMVSTLFHFFKKVYRIIGVVILVLGIVLSFFIPFFVEGEVPPNTQLMFMLFVLNTSVSYWMTASQTLLAADQKSFINTITKFFGIVIFQGIQIAVLVITKDYILFLIIQILNTFVVNFILLRLVKIKYPFIFDSKSDKLPFELLEEMKKNIFGMASAKFGGIVLTGSDNIVLSAFAGLTLVGQYSNYLLITTGLVSIYNMMQGGITASIGHLSAKADSQKQKNTFFQLFPLNALLNIVIALGMTIFFDTIIELWLGKNYVFDSWTTWLIAMVFFSNQIRQLAISYIIAYGLFWPLRYKSLIEAAINLGVSVVLVAQFNMGVNGILIGTIISNIAINFVWEGKIAFKLGLKSSSKEYFLKLFFVSIVAIVTALLGTFVKQQLLSEELFVRVLFSSVAYVFIILMLLFIFWLVMPESKKIMLRIFKS